ncbi:hypothetical protein D3C84_1262770 [compost metagenome]
MHQASPQREDAGTPGIILSHRQPQAPATGKLIEGYHVLHAPVHAGGEMVNVVLAYPAQLVPD